VPDRVEGAVGHLLALEGGHGDPEAVALEAM
jgi:hypothetical protein